MKMHERIRNYIESHGMKLNFVAERSGIKPGRFYRLINGDAPLTTEEYEIICRGLSVDPVYFFEDRFLESKKYEEVG